MRTREEWEASRQSREHAQNQPGSNIVHNWRDVSQMEKIRQLDADFKLEEESEEDEEDNGFRPRVSNTAEVVFGGTSQGGSPEGVSQTLPSKSDSGECEGGDMVGAALENDRPDLFVIGAFDNESLEEKSEQNAGETMSEVGSPLHSQQTKMGSSRAKADLRESGAEALGTGSSQESSGASELVQRNDSHSSDSDSERYDTLYQEHIRRQLESATAVVGGLDVEEEVFREEDQFEISQPDSESQQQALMTSLSHREQQFLASIRQLDQVELEEEEMSEASETDSEEERVATPWQGVQGRGGNTFDTTLPALHQYLGDFDDVAGGRAFEEGGSLMSLPLFHLDGVVLFPGDSLPLRAIPPCFQNAVKRAMRQTSHANMIAVVLCRGYFHPDGPGVALVGTSAEIRQVKEQDDGSFNIVAKGRQRFYIRRITTESDESATAHVEIIPNEIPLHMPRAAFSRLAAWPSLQTGRVPSTLEASKVPGSPSEESPATYSRTPRRASTGGIASTSASRRSRSALEASPSSAPLRSRRRVSFDGGVTASESLRRHGLDVFDFPIDEEQETVAAALPPESDDRPCEQIPDRTAGKELGSESTPTAGSTGRRHVATPRSELFLPAYKRRKQRRVGAGGQGVCLLSPGGVPETGRKKGGVLGPLIVWPEVCPARYEMARRTAADGAEETACETAGVRTDVGPALDEEEVVTKIAYVPPKKGGISSSPGNRGPRSIQDPEHWFRWGGRTEQIPRSGSRKPRSNNPEEESREESDGVTKAWAADEATWRIRAPLSAWPYWVYRMYDAYVLARRVADRMRHLVPAKKVNELLNEPEALSYYVASNLPVQDSTRQELLQTNGTVYRLRKEIKILETIDKLRCKACEAVVASKSDLVVMSADGPIGAYVNQHGHVHDTLTLRRVQRLELEGSPQTADSWFPGYAWTIAYCEFCGYHLGWKFTATSLGRVPESFWGLTRSHLAETTSEEDQSSMQTFSWTG